MVGQGGVEMGAVRQNPCGTIEKERRMKQEKEKVCKMDVELTDSGTHDILYAP